MRLKISDSGFSHLTHGNKGYSTHGKVSKHIHWCRDGSGYGKFYVDGWITTAHQEITDEPKYAWFLETKAIIPQLYEWLDNNIQHCIDTFDLIVVHDKKYLGIHPKFVWCPVGGSWIQDKRIYVKSKLVSMITSHKRMCPGHDKRLQWYDKLKDSVDCYGRDIKFIEKKEDGLKDYMFSVAIENAEYDGYFTEKILDCFLCGTIPVYLGAPNIGDYFNMDGVLVLKDGLDLTPQLYYSKLEAVIDNFNRALDYEVLEDWIYTNYLN